MHTLLKHPENKDKTKWVPYSESSYHHNTQSVMHILISGIISIIQAE